MSREKSIAYREDKITASSSSNDTDNHESLDTNQKQVPEAQISTHDADLSSAMPQRWGEVPSQQDPFTCKYKT
jgi:hypothetical protein